MKKSNDVKRLEEITKVMLKNDLKSGVSPSKVCNILTELGPTFIKIGQILSTRIDLLPKEYCAALSNLRNNTGVMPRDELEKILKEEYDDYKKVFKSVDECIGAASISEVYKGTLINGDTVAIKVCKKNVYEKMQNDVSLMKKAIKVLHLNKIIKIIDLNKALDEMLSSAYEESNFNIEKDHLIKFKKLNDNNYVTSPKVYSNISTNKVLVMEYVKGVSLDEKDALIKEGCNLENLSYILSDNYIKQALDDGFFHADPHPDNIMVRDNKIVFIDLGMMGTLKEKNKKLLNDAIEKIIEESMC
jgi:ubiquinone biosynthesis protein